MAEEKTSAEEEKKVHKARTIELVLFACAIFLKGDVILWNDGVHAGYQSFQLCIMVLAVGYLSMILCLSELTSIAAFAGGCYGYTRCSIGPYFGFLCGCCELLSMHIFAVLTVDSATELITAAYGTLSEWEMIWAGMVYALVAMVFLGRNFQFWVAMVVTAVFSLVIILMFLIGVMTQDHELFSMKLSEREKPYFEDGAKGWFNHLYFASWFFIGIECITVAGKKIQNPSKILSRALPISVVLATIFAFWVFNLVYFSLPYGMLEYFSSVPITIVFGFINVLKFSVRTSCMLCVPPLVSSSIGLMYSIINSTHAMAQSGMLPAWLKITVGSEDAPIAAILMCLIFQYGLFIAEYMPEEDVVSMIFPIGVLAACFSYLGVLCSFISFKTRFSGMGRLLTIPFWVCFFGLAVFLLEFVVVIVYDPQKVVANSFFFLFLFVLSLYYFLVVRNTQFFSKEEQDKFFKAYILNANKKRTSNRKSKKSGLLGAIAASASGIFGSQSKIRDASSKQRSGSSSAVALHDNNRKVAPLPSGGDVAMGSLAGKKSRVQPVQEVRQAALVD